MREIKFRAWDKAYKAMCYTPDGFKNVSAWLETPEVFVVMQYTGLHDSKGVEVYEGDILDDGGVIEFRTDLNWDSGGSVHSGFFSTKGYDYGETGCLSYHYQISEYKVVGNIYSNPELLKSDA